MPTLRRVEERVGGWSGPDTYEGKLEGDPCYSRWQSTFTWESGAN